MERKYDHVAPIFSVYREVSTVDKANPVINFELKNQLSSYPSPFEAYYIRSMISIAYWKNLSVCANFRFLEILEVKTIILVFDSPEKKKP